MQMSRPDDVVWTMTAPKYRERPLPIFQVAQQVYRGQ